MITDVNTAQRSKWIDVLKGIAIFFVVLGHSPYLTYMSPKVFNVIFSFHMPLFLFIAGYLFNSDQPALGLVRKRFNSLLKPYLFTIILISITYIVFKNGHSPLWYLFWIIYGNGPNLPKLGLHLWFLPHLFFVTLFIWSLFKLFKKLKFFTSLVMSTAIVFFVFGALSIDLFWNIKIPDSNLNSFINNIGLFLSNGVLDNPAYLKDTIIPNSQFILKGLPWSLDITLITSAFFITGYITKNYSPEAIFRKHYAALPILILFIIIHYKFNDTIDLNLRRYDNFFICSFLAIVGIYCCIYISHVFCITDNYLSKSIAYIGRYSLIVYIFHLFIQSKVYFAILTLLPQQAAIAFLPALIAGVAVPLLLNYFIFKRFNFFRFWYYSK